MRWGEWNGTTYCKVSVRNIEATNKHTGGIAVRASAGSETGREVKMKIDLQTTSGIIKTYQLPCLSGMGSERQVHEMKRTQPSRGAGGTSISVGIRLLRSVVLETIDPRAQDFDLTVRDTTISLRGMTTAIKDESGTILNRPRNTLIKIPLMKFVRCSAIKGTQVQFSLKPLRIFVALAASIFISSSTSDGLSTGSTTSFIGTNSFDEPAVAVDDIATSTVELLVNASGTRTRFQSHLDEKEESSSSFQFIFEFVSKSTKEGKGPLAIGAEKQDSNKKRMNRLKQQQEEEDDDPDDSETNIRVEHENELLLASSSRPRRNSQDDDGEDEDEYDGEDSSNRSFGKLIGRSVSTPSTTSATATSTAPGVDDNSDDYYLSQLLAQRRKDRKEHINKYNSMLSRSDDGDLSYIETEPPKKSIHKGKGWGRKSQDDSSVVGVTESATEGFASVGWITQDDGDHHNPQDYDLQEVEDYDEDVQELRPTQVTAIKGGLILDDLDPEQGSDEDGQINAIGPTQQATNTKVRGLFD